MTALKEMRISKQITQQEAARRLGISLRSYIMYENDATKENTIKYRFLMQELQKINAVDEEHGILTTEGRITLGGQHDMTKDKQIEENFSDILSMLKKKVQQKDEEIVRLREENIKLKEKLTEIDPEFVLEETFKRR